MAASVHYPQPQYINLFPSVDEPQPKLNEGDIGKWFVRCHGLILREGRLWKTDATYMPARFLQISDIGLRLVRIHSNRIVFCDKRGNEHIVDPIYNDGYWMLLEQWIQKPEIAKASKQEPLPQLHIVTPSNQSDNRTR